MELLRRIIVAFFGLLLAAAAIFIGVCLINHPLATAVVDFMDRCFVYNMQLTFVDGRMLWLPLLIGVFLLALGVLLLVAACYKSQQVRHVQVQSADGAAVQISLDAVDNIVKRAVGSVPQVNNLYTRMRAGKDGLHVGLRVSIPAGASIPQVGATVRQQVTEQLESMVGVTPVEIRVEVANVVDAPGEVG